MARAASNSSPAEALGDGAPAAPAAAPTSDPSMVVGLQLRRFRKEKGLTLRGLAAESGLSIGFLSQLERGRTSISLTALRDLAVALERDITEFFDDSGVEGALEISADDAPATPVTSLPDGSSTAEDLTSPGAVERYFTLTRASGEHTTQFLSGERTYRLLSKRTPGFQLEPMLVQIAPGGVLGDLEVHGGEEFAYVIEGELTYVVNGTSHRLTAGDSLHLKSTIPHALHNDTDRVTTVVSVVTPRLF